VRKTITPFNQAWLALLDQKNNQWFHGAPWNYRVFQIEFPVVPHSHALEKDLKTLVLPLVTDLSQSFWQVRWGDPLRVTEVLRYFSKQSILWHPLEVPGALRTAHIRIDREQDTGLLLPCTTPSNTFSPPRCIHS